MPTGIFPLQDTGFLQGTVVTAQGTAFTEVAAKGAGRSPGSRRRIAT
ncbi:MAG: hypothetical protein WDN45_16615 [Caulobacteraceae bacterium]